MPVLYLDKSYLNEIMSVQEIKCYTSVTDFSQHIKSERQPAILRQYNIGSCVTLWQNPEHLKVIICQIIIFCHKLTHNTKAWLATYFDLPHSQLRNSKVLRTRNRAQLFKIDFFYYSIQLLVVIKAKFL